MPPGAALSAACGLTVGVYACACSLWGKQAVCVQLPGTLQEGLCDGERSLPHSILKFDVSLKELRFCKAGRTFSRLLKHLFWHYVPPNEFLNSYVCPAILSR